MIAPKLSPHELFVLVTPAILLAAAASWHWVERPALDAYGVVMDWVLRGIIGVDCGTLSQPPDSVRALFWRTVRQKTGGVFDWRHGNSAKPSVILVLTRQAATHLP